MTILHRAPVDEVSDTSLEELYKVLGENDTPRLFDQTFTLDTDHDIPTGGANSIDRKKVYIDRTLYQEVMDGEYKATGLTPDQLIRGWVRHERIEVSIIVGENPVDTYLPAHNRALAAEHEFYKLIGVDPDKVEQIVWPGLLRAYHRDPKNPPADLWCGPLSDDPSPRDVELLERLARLGVADARKNAKLSVRYGIGEHYCRDCTMWSPKILSQEHGHLADCTAVSGIVRADRWCQLWRKAH